MQTHKQAGAVTVRLVQLEVLPARPEVNTRRMLDAVARARADGVALVAFPELAIPGYLLGDMWDRPAFLRACEACGERMREASQGILVVFGNVAVDWEKRGEDGRVRRYNALFFAENGRFCASAVTRLPFVAKTLLPNYRCFDDARHFFDTRRLALEQGTTPDRMIEPMQTSLGLIGGLLCEDAWDTDYAFSPAKILAHKGARFLINASCSPFTGDKNHKRNRVFNQLACDTRLPLLYVNTVGVQDIGKTVYMFDGASCIYDGHGNAVQAGPPFEEAAATVTLPADGAPFGEPVAPRRDSTAALAQALEFGVRGLMRRLGIRRVVVGISGGIDSALTAALYSRILAPEDLLLLNLPGPFSSQTTRGLARRLAEALGGRYAEVPITAAVELTRGQIDHLPLTGPGGTPAGALTLGALDMENIQARDRGGRVLAAAAAAFGGVFTCNANKAEITVGYGTLYGDICGWLAALGDLWKEQVYAVARHLNAEGFDRPVIPEGIFAITPSAELNAAQAVDEGKGDPLIYPYHDTLFRAWVERWDRATPEDILEWYASGELEGRIGYAGTVAALFPDARAFVADLERWWMLYQGLGVAKRLQAPPVLAVSRRAFGFDHREAQLGPWFSDRYQELRARVLA
ncbi:MAG: NAD(+) synthase [Lentisphaerae bacterium]|nr:NAD(+) synthase [Lentisphaerota bacterium]